MSKPLINLEADYAAVREGAKRLLDIEIGPMKGAGAPEVKKKEEMKKITPFSEIAKNLDPMLPKVDYDNIRQGYFFNSVAPHLDPKADRSAAYEEFKKQTERPPLMNSLERIGLNANVGLIQAENEMLNPLTPFIKAARDRYQSNEEWMRVSERALRREGTEPGMAKVVGQIIGSVPGFEVAGALAAPVAAAMTVKRAYAGAKALNLANRTLHAGLATSAYEIAREQEGGKLVNGLKGFGVGGAAGALLGLPSFLGREATRVTGPDTDRIGEALAAKVVKGEPIPRPLDEAAAAHIKSKVEVANMEGRPGAITEDPSIRGVRVTFADAAGNERTLQVKAGDETAAVNEVMGLLDRSKGGITNISYHPKSFESMGEFVDILSSKSRGKYEFGTKVISTEEGAAEAVAAKAQEEGLEATAISPNKVAVDAYNPLEDIRNRPAVMTKERAAQLVKTLGGDEKQVDLDVVMRLNADEIQGLVDFTKNLGSEIEQVFKAETTGGIEEGVKFNVPSFEKRLVSPTKSISEQTEIRSPRPAPAKLVSRPTKNRIVLPSEEMVGAALGAEGAAAATFPTTASLFERLGIKAPPGYRTDLPAVILGKGAGRATVWHEGTHADLARIGYEFVPRMRQWGKGKEQGTVGTLLELAQGFKDGAVEYSKFNMEDLANEAFTWSAMAVRHNDIPLLNQLGNIDSGVGNVLKMVHAASLDIADTVRSKLDSMPTRLVQNKMEDLIRRTDRNVTYQLRQAARDGNVVFWEDGKWTRIDDMGVGHSYTSKQQMYDALNARDAGKLHEPGITYMAELKGIRGPLLPGGITPSGKRMPMPTEPVDPDRGILGWKAVSGWWRPFLDWTASTHKLINETVAPRGEYIPLFEKVRAVDKMVREAAPWVDATTVKFGQLMKGVDTKKLHDYFEALVQLPSRFTTTVTEEGEKVTTRLHGLLDDKAIERLNLTPDDVGRIHNLHQAFLDFADDTKINVIDYFNRWFPQLRKANWNPDGVWPVSTPGSEGFWEDAVRNGFGFKPDDNHLGRFTKWLIDQGAEKKFTGQPVKELQALINRKGVDGTYILGSVRNPIQRYVDTIQNIPDPTQRAMNTAVKTFTDGLARWFTKANEHLPEGMKVLPEEFNGPTALQSKLLQFMYASGVGLKPINIIRDYLQMFITGGPIYGSKLFSGIANSMTAEGWERAKQAGALLGPHNAGEMYNEIFRGLPIEATKSNMQRIADTMLAPARWGNNAARAAIYDVAYKSSLSALEKLRAGEIDQMQFLKSTGLWAHNETVISEHLLATQSGKPIEDIARQIGLDMVDRTQYAYRKGTAPTMLQTGLGRMFGMYGTWPLSYIDFLATMTQKAGQPEFRDLAMGSIAKWAAINYAAAHVMEQGFGADSSNYLWFAPTGYTGGPQKELVENLMQVGQGGQIGAQARKRIQELLEYSFIPGGGQFNRIQKMLDDGIDPMSPEGMIIMMGARPYREPNQ